MIPLSVPCLEGNEWLYVKECIDTGWISSAGKFVERFELELAQYVGAPYAVATVNGTAALQIALLVAGCTEDDAVILPNLTFVASANSIAYIGAEPIFIDVDPTHWQMDLDLLDEFLSTNCDLEGDGCRRKSDGKLIRFVMPVHTLGDICDMKRLQNIASKFNLIIIEDSTEALGSNHMGTHSGLFGDLGTFSFNGNKIISTGGGGMIVTKDESKAKLAKHLTTQAKVPGSGYFHDQVGYNFRLVNVLAAIGVAQLEQLPSILEAKRRTASHYRRSLEGVGDIQFPEPVNGTNSNGWLNTFRTNNKERVLSVLAKSNIEARPFWTPMNQLPMFRSSQYIAGSDIANSLYEGCVSVPSSANVTSNQVIEVCDAIKAAFS